MLHPIKWTVDLTNWIIQDHHILKHHSAKISLNSQWITAQQVVVVAITVSVFLFYEPWLADCQ